MNAVKTDDRLRNAAPQLLAALERIMLSATDDHECAFCDNHITMPEEHDEDCPAWIAHEAIALARGG